MWYCQDTFLKCLKGYQYCIKAIENKDMDMYLKHIIFQFLTIPFSFIYGESLATFLSTFRQ